LFEIFPRKREKQNFGYRFHFFIAKTIRGKFHLQKGFFFFSLYYENVVDFRGIMDDLSDLSLET
jgi:hypothetical protein